MLSQGQASRGFPRICGVRERVNREQDCLARFLLIRLLTTPLQLGLARIPAESPLRLTVGISPTAGPIPCAKPVGSHLRRHPARHRPAVTTYLYAGGSNAPWGTVTGTHHADRPVRDARRGVRDLHRETPRAGLVAAGRGKWRVFRDRSARPSWGNNDRAWPTDGRFRNLPVSIPSAWMLRLSAPAGESASIHIAGLDPSRRWCTPHVRPRAARAVVAVCRRTDEEMSGRALRDSIHQRGMVHVAWSHVTR